MCECRYIFRAFLWICFCLFFVLFLAGRVWAGNYQFHVDFYDCATYWNANAQNKGLGIGYDHLSVSYSGSSYTIEVCIYSGGGCNAVMLKSGTVSGGGYCGYQPLGSSYTGYDVEFLGSTYFYFGSDVFAYDVSTMPFAGIDEIGRAHV